MKHEHHKIPRHVGGTDDPANIELLTIEQHAEAHKKLYEEYGRWQDKVAWQGLAGIIGHEEAVRLALGHRKGKKHRPETIEKMRKPKSPEHAAKVGLTKRGKPRSEETKRKISASKKKSNWKPVGEHLEKLRRAARKPKSEETRAKMSIARKLYWERKKAENAGSERRD